MYTFCLFSIVLLLQQNFKIQVAGGRQNERQEIIVFIFLSQTNILMMDLDPTISNKKVLKVIPIFVCIALGKSIKERRKFNKSIFNKG